MKINKIGLYFMLVILLIIPLVLLFLPSSYFDTGDSVCLSQTLFNQTCYGCGITRAVQHFLHGEIKIALSYNKLVLVVFPLLLFLWGQNIWFLYKRIKKS